MSYSHLRNSQESQQREFAEFLETHKDSGIGYYHVPCPKCRVMAGVYCGDYSVNGNYTIRPIVCPERKKLWDAMGRPIVNTPADSLLLAMWEATHEDQDGQST